MSVPGAGRMGAVAIIPARLASTRLPDKPLALLAGKPMLQHVYERARQARTLSGVIVATPDPEIVRAVRGWGGQVVLTDENHPTGTDRVAEACRDLPRDMEVIVNIQGDEPLIDPDTIDAVAAPLLADPALVMASARCPLPLGRETDPAVVKVVCDKNGFALYFSRSPLPYRRSPDAPAASFQHVGLYAYRRDFLLTLAALPPTPLEQAESLEQLRALENGYRIRIIDAPPAEAVDTPEDLERVRAHFARKGLS